jgi:hypothetical protein
MNSKISVSEYSTPKIVDYGSLEELTAGCTGSPSDYRGLNNALTNSSSKGNCTSTG